MPRMVRAAILQVLLWLASIVAVSGPALADPPTAQDFVRDPNVTQATLSPDGRFVAVIRWDDDGQELLVYDWHAAHAQAIERARSDRFLFIDWVAWKNDNRLLFALHQRGYWHGRGTGMDEATHIFAVNRDGTSLTEMFQGQFRQLATDILPPQLVDIGRNDPAHVLLTTYGSYGFSLFSVDVNTGQARNLERMEWRTGFAMVDGAGNLVMRADGLPEGSGFRYYRRAPGTSAWTLAYEVRRASVAQNRDFVPLGPGPGAGQVYVAARPAGQEFQAIYVYDTRTGELGSPVFQYEHADAEVASLDRNDNSLLIGCGELQRWQCRAQDPHLQRHVAAISAYFEGLADFVVTDVSADRKAWLVYANGPTIPGTYYVYDLDATRIVPIASEYPHIARSTLAQTSVVQYAGRDGAALWGYLTVPVGAGAHPLVVLPHGGPESRDSFNYDFFVEYLATRGYAVFRPNFRGSEGSGRSFADAGHRQWGLRMQDDITDGVQHLVQAGVADGNRICIVGASYGGYAALAGVALTPTLYKCAISISGVSDLPEVLNSERLESGRGSLGYAYWTNLIGDPDRDRDALVAASPARQAAAVTAPVLLIHGSDDSIVPFHQSEIMRDALHRAGKQVEFIRLENEGHIWSYWTPEDRLRLLNEVTRFLDAHIGASGH